MAPSRSSIAPPSVWSPKWLDDTDDAFAYVFGRHVANNPSAPVTDLASACAPVSVRELMIVRGRLDTSELHALERCASLHEERVAGRPVSDADLVPVVARALAVCQRVGRLLRAVRKGLVVVTSASLDDDGLANLTRLFRVLSKCDAALKASPR